MQTPVPRFRTDGSFTILQLTDLHVQNGDAADQLTARLIGQLLDNHKPDLVALTGDVIAGGGCADPFASWKFAVAPLIERGIPWAAVFGNHDDEGTADRSALMAYQQNLPGCLSQTGPAEVDGVGNYVIRIQQADSDNTAAVLYFLDSHAYSDESTQQYAWIMPTQLEWFREQAKQFRSSGRRPVGLMFFHIPLSEFNEAWEQGNAVGVRHERVCCPQVNSGFFDCLCKAGGVSGLFVGHDHVNDFVADLRGIRLCYGRATGFNTYGRVGFARGGRVIRLRVDRAGFETEVVLGTV